MVSKQLTRNPKQFKKRCSSLTSWVAKKCVGANDAEEFPLGLWYPCCCGNWKKYSPASVLFACTAKLNITVL